MHPDEYQEHVLNAPDVCNSCFSLVRVERERPPVKWRPAERFYARNQATTSVEHVQAETVSETKQVFCECGADSAFTRVWNWRDVDRERFKQLLQQLIRSVERKGLQVARQPMAAHALQAFAGSVEVHGDVRVRIGDEVDVDAMLATGLLAGLRIQAARNAADRQTA